MHCAPKEKVRFQLSKRFFVFAEELCRDNREYLFPATVPEAFLAWTGVSVPRLVPLPFLGVLATSDLSAQWSAWMSQEVSKRLVSGL